MRAKREQSSSRPTSKPGRWAPLARFVAGLAVGGLTLGASAFDRPGDGVYADRIDWGVMWT